MTDALPELLRRQIDYITAGDLDGLMTQYADDVLLVRPDLQVRGRDAVREVMAAYLARGPRVETVDAVAAEGDLVVYAATLNVGGTRLRGVGTFVLDGEGRIVRQSAVVLPL